MWYFDLFEVVDVFGVWCFRVWVVVVFKICVVCRVFDLVFGV